MLISFNILNTDNKLVSMIMDFLFRLIEPLLKVIRKVIPNFGAIDISPILLIIIIEAFQFVMTKYGF
jgi:YggT family protein